MPGKKESTMQWKIDIAQFKKNITDAKRQIQLANAEFKTASAGMDNWSKSTTGLEKKLDQLNKTLPAQNKILSELENEYKTVAKEFGESSEQAQKLKIQVENQRAVVAKTESQIAKYTSNLNKMRAEEAKSNSEISKLTATIAAQEKQLSGLKDEYKNAVLMYGENSKEAKELAKQIKDLSGELAENKSDLDKANKSADAFDQTLDDTKKDVKDTSEGFTVMKGVLADLVASGIKAAVDGFKKLASAAGDAYKSFDEGRDTIVKLTGATGEAGEALEGIFKNVSKTVVADSKTIGSAIGEVSTRFGLQGEELEALSTSFVKFAEINGTDVINSVDGVQKAMSAYGVATEDAGKFLDRLSKTAQDTGVSTDSLTSGIISNATAFQELGLTVDEAVILMGQLEKSGANSETVLNGMRKALKNSAKDGKPLNDVLASLQNTIKYSKDETIGLNKAYEVFGKSGDQIFGAIRNGALDFKSLSGAIEDASGVVDKTYAGTVDGFDSIGLAIQGVKTELGDYVGDLLSKYQPDIDAFISNIVPKFEEFARSVIDGIATAAPKVEQFFNFIKENKDYIIAALTAIATGFLAFKVVGIIQGVTAAIQGMTIAQAALNAVMAMNPIGLVVAAIAALVAAFVVLWKKSEAFRAFWINLFTTIKKTAVNAINIVVNFFKSAWDKIKKVWAAVAGFFRGVWTAVKAIFAPVAGFFKTIFSNAWTMVKNVWILATFFFSKIWEGIKAVFTPILAFFRGIFSQAFNAVKSVWNAATGFFRGIWNGIKSVFASVVSWFSEKFSKVWEAVKKPFEAVGSFFGGIWDTIKSKFTDIGQKIGDSIGSAFKGAINAALQMAENVLNAPINAINGLLDLINKIPGIELGKLTPFSLPRLARGGVLNSARAVVAGEAGAEAIVPLEKNTEWIKRVVSGVLDALDVQGVKSSVAVGGLRRSTSYGVTGASGSGRTVVFNQTINSPKALDRLSVYRDTNMLLFNAKIRYGNV